MGVSWSVRTTIAVKARLADAPTTSIPQPRDTTSAPPQSIVVLPFTNAARDPEQEYFVDGMTEDLTTDLSRIPGAFVITPATAFTYKGKPVDVRQIGSDLSVRYALQGSARKVLDTVRINAQLVDTSNSSLLGRTIHGRARALPSARPGHWRCQALKIALVEESTRIAKIEQSQRHRSDHARLHSSTGRRAAELQRARELFKRTGSVSPFRH
jgi:TolB-like protein